MRPGAARPLVAVLLVLPMLLVAGACAPAATLSPASGGSLAPLVSPVTGRLVDIDARGLSEVTAFTLRMDDGREVRLEIGALENGGEFPPGHLAEHMATATPVRAFFRDEGGRLVAYRLEDG